MVLVSLAQQQTFITGGSPLVQGGLEILCGVVVKMLSCEKNVVAIDKLKILVIDHYQEPIDSNLPDATRQILAELISPDNKDNGAARPFRQQRTC